MPKITPFLWFEDNAEEAANFYKSVFKNVSGGQFSRVSDNENTPAGKSTIANINIEGLDFTFLNGGPVSGFKFSPATSFLVTVDSQDEIDELWSKLADGGQEMQCGWLTDKFGVTWQIIPSVLNELMSDPDQAKAQRVTESMLKMVKIDIPTLLKAAEGK